MVSHRVATSLLHSRRRLQPRQDEHTWRHPLHTPCTATRSPTDHWGAGPAPRPLGAEDGSAQVSPVRLRRVIDPLRCARRYAAPLDGGYPERCDKRLVAMGRLSHVCLPYTTLGVYRTTSPLPHRASLVPWWDISRHRCYTLCQAGRAWAARHPNMHKAPVKEANDGYCRRAAISA
jgi:hypothetical protein